MQYGAFWGLTVPSLLLMNLNRTVLAECVNLLNNSKDSSCLKDLKQEIVYCRNALNRVDYVFDDPADMRKLNSLNLSKEHYRTGIKVPKSMLIPESELPLVEEMLNNKPKTKLNSVVKINGKNVQLSNEALKIINFLKNSAYMLDVIDRAIVINSFNDQEVFGDKLLYFINRSPYFLINKIITNVSAVKDDKKLLNELIEQYRTDIDKVFEIVVDAGEITNSNNDLEVIPSSVIKPQEFYKNKTNTVNAYCNCHKLNFKYVPLINHLFDLKLLNKLKPVSVKYLTDVYESVLSLNIDKYNQLFDLDLTKEQYESVFKELDNIGFVGLNFYEMELFKNSFYNLLIAVKYDLKIFSNSDLYSSIVLVKEFLDTQLEYGGAIGES